MTECVSKVLNDSPDATACSGALGSRLSSWLDRAAASKLEHIPIEKGIFIYGAGELGALAVDYCENCGIPILGVVDRVKTGTLKSGARTYEIRHPAEFAHAHKQMAPVAIAVATIPVNPLKQQLEMDGWRWVTPFYCLTEKPHPGHPLRNGWMVGRCTIDERETVAWIDSQWADEYSRQHYEAFIAWHSDLSELLSHEFPIKVEERYTIPPLLDFFKKRNRQFVDVGAHRGESVRRLQVSDIRFLEYVLIEPDQHSRQYLEAIIDTLIPPDSRISILHELLGAQQGEQPFQDGLGYCSQIWFKSEQKRNTTTLDDLALCPDFIKIHTEGIEICILKGSSETISRFQPAIAMSVYHSRAGFCDDISEAMHILQDYRFYFRLHSYQGTGAFLYAIPPYNGALQC